MSKSKASQTENIGEKARKIRKKMIRLAMRAEQLTEEYRSLPILHSTEDVALFLNVNLGLRDREQWWVILMDTSARVIDFYKLYEGTVAEIAVRPAEVFMEAVRQNAPMVMVVHNHTSLQPFPSQSDVDLTRKLFDVGKMLGIVLVDHIIVGGTSFMSLNDLKVLEEWEDRDIETSVKLCD